MYLEDIKEGKIMSEKTHHNIFLLDGLGSATPVALESKTDQPPESGLLWFNLDINHPDARKILKHRAGLDAFTIAALTEDETRPRVFTHGDGLIAILRGVNLNPGAEPDDMVSVRIWIDQNRIVTTRKRNLQSLNDIQEALQSHTGPVSAADFLSTLTNRLIYHIGSLTVSIEDSIAGLEELSLTDETAQLRTELIRFRRATVGLRRYLAPMREALVHLQNERINWFTEENRLRFREVADRIVRIVEDMDMIRERGALIHEELTAKLSDQLNKRLYLLSIVAAIFLPLSFFTGLLGINIGGIPGANNPWAFYIFIGLLLVIVIGQFWYFKTRKWL